MHNKKVIPFPDKDFSITFPEVASQHLDQDEEFCYLHTGESKRRIRFHDYGEIYNIPGLYEYLFYEKLECQSPSILGTLLDHEVSRQGKEMKDLCVLDVGAGNGIMGEVLSEAGVREIVGVDILPEAAEAAERDRPGLYDAYYSVDLLNPPEEVHQDLESREFNCLTMVAAMGFGDISPDVFAKAYNLIEDGGFVTFNLKENYLDEQDQSGFSELIQRMTDEQFDSHLKVKYVHRLSVTGDPLYYTGIIGQKRSHLPVQ